MVGLIGAAATGFIFFIFLLASPKLAIVLAALAGAATVGVVVATFKKFHQLYLGNSAVKRRRKQELGKRLDSLLCPTCAETENWAAAYEGWQGTVHTFWFASADFARLFRASNPKKCLSDGGIHY